MPTAALSKVDSAAAPTPTRETVLARYRRLRAISRELHHRIIDFVPPGAVPRHASRLGLAEGRTVTLYNMDDLSFIFDLAIHTARTGSEEACVLAAMQQTCFAVVHLKERHSAAGLIFHDVLRNEEVWLVDEGLEASAPERLVMATRFFTPGPFAMTAGVHMPCNLALMQAVLSEVPQLLRKPEDEMANDRRFAEAIYRAGFADGMIRRRNTREPTSPEAA